MAFYTGDLPMKGSIKLLSYYKLYGTNKIVARTKGGPSKEKIQNSPKFATLRKHQQEWKGCVLFSKSLKKALGYVFDLADYNLSPVWNGLAKNIIKMDEEHPVGERSLMVSAFKQELEGFQLNRNYKFNALIGIQPQLVLDTETLYASATFEPFSTAQQLLNIRKLPYFRFILSVGMVSDSYFSGGRDPIYLLHHSSLNGANKCVNTEWLSTNDRMPELKLEIQFDENEAKYKRTQVTHLLSLGIEFGAVGFGGKIEAVKHTGAGRIMLAR